MPENSGKEWTADEILQPPNPGGAVGFRLTWCALRHRARASPQSDWAMSECGRAEELAYAEGHCHSESATQY